MSINISKSVNRKLKEAFESIYLDDFDELVVLDNYLIQNFDITLGEAINIDRRTFMKRFNEFLFENGIPNGVWLVDFDTLIPQKLKKTKRVKLPQKVVDKISKYVKNIEKFINGERKPII